MIHAKSPAKIKRYSAITRIDEAEKAHLRVMAREHPLYSESIIIRAALQSFLALGYELRGDIILASLNESDVGEVMRRGGIMKDNRPVSRDLYPYPARAAHTVRSSPPLRYASACSRRQA